MSYVLFLVFNAMVFVLAAELIEGLQPSRLYELAILGWLLTTCPLMFSLLSIVSPLRCPISLCVIGLFLLIVLTRLRFRSRSCWGWSRSCFLGLRFFPASALSPAAEHRPDSGLPVPSNVEGRGGSTEAPLPPSNSSMRMRLNPASVIALVDVKVGSRFTVRWEG